MQTGRVAGVAVRRGWWWRRGSTHIRSHARRVVGQIAVLRRAARGCRHYDCGAASHWLKCVLAAELRSGHAPGMAFYQRARVRLEQAIAQRPETYPYPVDHCGLSTFLPTRTRMTVLRRFPSTAAVACATLAGMASSSTPKSTAAQSRRSFQRRRIRCRARDPRPRAARRSAGSRADGPVARRAGGRPSASMPAGTASGRCRSARSR